MNYVIFDSSANLVDSYDQEQEALKALGEIVHSDPDSADEFALFTYDEMGNPVGEAIVGSDQRVPA